MDALKLGWIDYSSEHRDKVMAVLHALSEPGAVDELGIGLIRDGFADIFFPGTSTIQTRAKYFFIVPYLLMELEREQHASPDAFLEKLGEEEVALIDKLNEGKPWGVFGAQAKHKLKRKPSSVYWNGLKTFEIFKHPSSLNNYAKVVFRMKNRKEAFRMLANEEQDTEDTTNSEYSNTFWRCLLPRPDWKESLSIELTYEEANFLKERMTQAEKSKDSLLAYLLKIDPKEIEQIDRFEDLGALQLPKDIEADYQMATRFNQFISGANIRYNFLLSNEENEDAHKQWNEWFNCPFVKYEFPTYECQKVIKRLNIKNSRLILFLKKWQEAVISGDLKIIDELIVKREIELKSKNRAKLRNPEVYQYEEDNWVGTSKLKYRFPDTKNLLEDIFRGLGDSHA